MDTKSDTNPIPKDTTRTFAEWLNQQRWPSLPPTWSSSQERIERTNEQTLDFVQHVLTMLPVLTQCNNVLGACAQKYP